MTAEINPIGIDWESFHKRSGQIDDFGADARGPLPSHGKLRRQDGGVDTYEELRDMDASRRL